jgi:hypothetical protein
MFAFKCGVLVSGGVAITGSVCVVRYSFSWRRGIPEASRPIGQAEIAARTGHENSEIL